MPWLDASIASAHAARSTISWRDVPRASSNNALRAQKHLGAAADGGVAPPERRHRACESERSCANSCTKRPDPSLGSFPTSGYAGLLLVVSNSWGPTPPEVARAAHARRSPAALAVTARSSAKPGWAARPAPIRIVSGLVRRNRHGAASLVACAVARVSEQDHKPDPKRDGARCRREPLFCLPPPVIPDAPYRIHPASSARGSNITQRSQQAFADSMTPRARPKVGLDFVFTLTICTQRLSAPGGDIVFASTICAVLSVPM